MRSLGATGDLVKFAGMIAIIVVMSTVVVASLISRSNVLAVMPDSCTAPYPDPASSHHRFMTPVIMDLVNGFLARNGN